MTNERSARHCTRLELFKSEPLYPVITKKFCNGRKPVDILKAVMDGGCRLVQLREKEMPQSEYLALAGEFRKITSGYRALLVINDRMDIALAVDADGVHLGQEDMPCKQARLLAPDLLIGVSTHNPREIHRAVRDGASTINIGPIYATATKEVSIKPVGAQNMVRWSKGLKIPFSVMGGIKEGNIPLLRQLGARCFAMVTEITQADDVGAKVRSLMTLLSAHPGS